MKLPLTLTNYPIFFVLMPYIGISILPSDVQPFALFFSAFALLISSKKIEFDRFFFILTLILFCAIAAFLVSFYDSQSDLMYNARSLFGYLSAPIIYLYFYNYLKGNGFDALVKLLDLAVAVVFAGFVLNLIGLSSIIQVFVNRSVFDEGTLVARGLTSFFPEQSRVPTQAVFFAMLYLLADRLDWRRACILFIMGALSASGQFFINVTVFALGVVLAIFCASLRSGRLRLGHCVYAAGGGMVLLGMVIAARDYHHSLIEMGLPQRGIVAFHQITTSGLRSFSDDLGFLFKISGPLQGISAIVADPISFRLGGSFYFYQDQAVLSQYINYLYGIFNTNLLPLPMRSYSIFGSWWTDFRLLGLIFSAVFLWMIVRAVLLVGSRSAFIVLFVMVFLLVFRSNTSDPTPWAVIAALIYCAQARFRSSIS